MNAVIGLSSLSAAFLSEILAAGSADVLLIATVAAGTALLLREVARTLQLARTDTFDRYQEARTRARGLEVI